MGKKAKERPPPPAGPSGPFNAAFAGLGGLRDALPAGGTPPSAANDPQPRQEPTSSTQPTLAGRLVVRIERKGHGGKTVTLLLGLRATEAQRRQLARELGRALGCAARVDGEQLVLAGDQRERLAQWLGERGGQARVV